MNVRIQKVTNAGMQMVPDKVAVEEPLEIRLLFYEDEMQRSKTIAITMRTPGQDEHLAAGFLYTEGILKNRQQVYKIALAPANEQILIVSLVPSTSPVLQGMERNFYTTSACGICGKTSIDAIKINAPFTQEPDSLLKVDTNTLYALPNRLLAQQELFESTGGLHAAALFTDNGTFITLQEDVGRHNALDKLIGKAFLNHELPLNHSILLLSGRASFELIQKAHMAGIVFIAAAGAPSSLAVNMAEEAGITLIGFLKDSRFNIYTHAQRVMIG